MTDGLSSQTTYCIRTSLSDSADKSASGCQLILPAHDSRVGGVTTGASVVVVVGDAVVVVVDAVVVVVVSVVVVVVDGCPL